jgi:hypothetical protein
MSVAERDTTVPGSAGARSFLLQRVQPAMTGLIDGPLSTTKGRTTPTASSSPHVAPGEGCPAGESAGQPVVSVSMRPL